MRIKLFYHSLLSDWNHGNAHFLRGIVRELKSYGHDVTVYEPVNNWSLKNLLDHHGNQPLREFREIYSGLNSRFYDPEQFDPLWIEDADLIIVHEWNTPQLVAEIGKYRKPHQLLLFHDTHHRSVSEPDSMQQYDLSRYDGVLAFGETVRQQYLINGWAAQAWTWHEAADTQIFYPREADEKSGDLVWIGNWGDGERDAELREFLLKPIHALKLKARFYGVRYPGWAQIALQEAGVDYAGWLPNYRVPEVFARFRVTVHVPRRFYRESLPGIPTIRPFEALACKIPLISAPWEDTENLFTPGKDYLVANNGEEMWSQLYRLLHEPELAQEIAEHGYQTLISRHTCKHRVDELLSIYQEADNAKARV